MAFVAATLVICGMLLVPDSALAAGDTLTMQVLDASGNELSNGGTTTPSSYRDANGAVRLSVTLNNSDTNNVVTVTLPRWFSWYGAQDGSDYTVSLSSANGGSDNVLEITFADPTTDGQGYAVDFNFRLSDSMDDATIESLENGGLTDMTFSAQLMNSAGTTNASDITLGYDWEDPDAATLVNLYVGPIGNLVGQANGRYSPGVVQTGIYNDLNGNENALAQVVIPATDPFRYGRAVSSIEITLDESARDIYRINGLTTATGSNLVTSFDDYDVTVSDDGNTLTLTPKSTSQSVDLTDVDQDRLVGAVSLGFRLDDGTYDRYDRDNWYQALTVGTINSGDLLHVKVNYTNFTHSGSSDASTSSTTATSTMTVVDYVQTTPSVFQDSADTSTYLRNQELYGDDPITVAAVVDEAGAADQTVWIGESLRNIVSYSSTDDKVSIPTDASGYSLVTEYPYEVRGTEFQIRPKYAATASTLADEFSPGGFELEKVVFTLSDGSTVEVSANNSTFADDWNTALSSNGTMTVTADQLGVVSSFTSSNEGSVKYVTKVTQVFETATPSIITDTSNYWSFRMTKWSMTTYEEDGTTEVGTGSLTHADATVEEGGKRWYPITSTLYDSDGSTVGSAEHDIQVKQSVCPEFELVSTSGSAVFYNQWKYQSENETGPFLGIRVQQGTDLSEVNTTLTNPKICFYLYWMDNIYTWTGEMDVTPAMAGWTVTYGVTTYAKQAAGEPVEVRTMQLPSEEDFNDPSKTNADGTITIDLLPATDGDETGSDWEYIASSSSVGVSTDTFGRARNAEIMFTYEGDWDVTTVADQDGDGVIDNNGVDGYLIKNIVASSRTFDVDGQYAFYWWFDGGHATKLSYQWDNCEDNDAAHLSSAESSSGVGNWGHATGSVPEQLGAQLITPTKLESSWTGTLTQGETTTISGSMTMTAGVTGDFGGLVGDPEWQPTGDVLYLEFPDTNVEFAGNATVDGVEDPDAYVTTINGKRYLVLHDNSPAGTVKATTSEVSTPRWGDTAVATFEPLTVSFDVFTMPTASASSATEVIGDDTYLDFSAHQVYDNVSNNPSDGTYRTAIQRSGGIAWSGWRSQGACVDNPLGVHTKSDITDHFWAIKTTGTSITAALNANLGLTTYSGLNSSSNDDPSSLALTSDVQVVKADEQGSMETLVALGAGENGLSNAEIVVEIPTDGSTVTDGSEERYSNTTGAALRGAVKQYGSLSSGGTLTFRVSTDGVTYEDVTDSTDWSSVRYVKATIDHLDAYEVAMFTLPLEADEGTTSGDTTYVRTSASFTENGSDVNPVSVTGYSFEDFVLSGVAWEDTDRDGVLDEGETGRRSGVTITATDSDGNQVGTATTGSDGTWTMGVSSTDEITLSVSPSSGLTTYTADVTDNKFDPDTASYALGALTDDVSGIDVGYYGTTPATTTISGTKTLTRFGEPATMTAGQFQAAISAVSSNDATGYSGFEDGSVDIAADGTFSFDAITFTKAGTYQFDVSEVQGSEEDITYDDTVYTVVIEVTKDEDADALVATQRIYRDGVQVDGITFENVSGDVVMHDPPVTKTIIGDTPATDATFTFTMTAEPDKSTLPDGMASDAMPMPEGTESGAQSKDVQVTGEGSVEIGDIVFTEPGTYVYSVVERDTGEDGYSYDESTYEITYVVSLNADGTALECTRSITKDGEAYDGAEFEFTNEYTQPASTGSNGNGGNNSGKATPKTGDNTQLMAPALIIVAIVLVVIGIVVARKNKRGGDGGSSPSGKGAKIPKGQTNAEASSHAAGSAGKHSDSSHAGGKHSGGGHFKQ